jgi:hypothetical protein
MQTTSAVPTMPPVRITSTQPESFVSDENPTTAVALDVGWTKPIPNSWVEGVADDH